MEIGVCGYGYSGSGAVICLLKEYEGINYLDGKTVFEFSISYVSDGLEDLEFNLCKNPSKGTRCDIAIYRFKKLVDFYERSYNRITNNQFRRFANDYITDLIQAKWKAYRVFEYERSKTGMLVRRILGMINTIVKKRGIDYNCFPIRERYLSIYPNNFVPATKKFINNILTSGGDYNCLLLDQPFSIGNPLNSMRFFEDPKCIIVDRDPRDLYVMAKNIYGTNALFIPTDTVDNFIEYYKRVRDDKLYKNSNNILKIQFEDLIYKYHDTVSKIEEFLEFKIGKHVDSYRYFNPAISCANVNVYRSFPQDEEAIGLIENHLSMWLYDFPTETNENAVQNLNQFTFM